MMSFRKACVALLLFPVAVSYAQEKHFKQSMFSDLEVVTSRSQTKGDTVFAFHVSEEDHHFNPESSKRYFWFYQGEIRSNVGSYSGKLLHGMYEKFDRRGNLFEKGEFNNGLKVGQWLRWHTGGIVAQRYSWSDGMKTSDFTEYYPNGQLSKTGAYRKGKLDGTIVYYAVDGRVMAEDIFKNGRFVKTKVSPPPVSVDTAKKDKRKGLFRKREKADTIKTPKPEKKKKEKVSKQQPFVDTAVPPPANQTSPDSPADKPKKKRKKKDTEVKPTDQ